MARVLSLWRARLSGAAIGLLFRACRWSFRAVTLGEEQRRAGEALSGGRPPIFALLHAHQLALIAYNFYPRFGVITSRSRDGEIAAAVLRTFQMAPLRGSSSRGGEEALAAATAHVAAGHPLGITVDGPRGPRGAVKRGVCEIARRTGRAVVPLAAVPAWRVETRSWDRFQIPLPGARLVVVFGAPFTVPAAASEPEVFACCDRLAAALAELEQRALTWCATDEVSP